MNSNGYTTAINALHCRFRQATIGAAVLLALCPITGAAEPRQTGANGVTTRSVKMPLAYSAAAYDLRTVATPPLNLGALGPLMPEIATAPAPPWLKPGFRLVYSGGVATIEASSPGSGRGHSLAAVPRGHWNHLALNGSAGMTQYDVIAVEGGVAVINSSLYLQPNGPGSAPQLSTSSIIVGAPGGTGDIWIQPDLLKKFKSPGKEVTVTRMPFDLNGHQVPAVWIKTTNDKGYEVHVYEEATGMLIHYSGSEAGAAGKTQFTGTLAEKRQLNPPWLDHYKPPATMQEGQLRYAGAVETSVPGSFPLPGLPLNVTIVPKDHGTGWVTFSESIIQNNGLGVPAQTTEAETAVGPGQLVNLWLPPADLEALKNRQVLDNDPVTQVVTTVSRRRGMVLISQAAPVQRIDFGYDPGTGMLIFLGRTDAVGPATMQTHIQLQHG